MNGELQFLIYNTPEEDVAINAVVKDETIWLTQKAMAELFDVEVPAISKHISNIFSEGELQVESTVSKMEIVQTEGKGRISKKHADDRAKAEYKEYNKTQKINSDFDKQVKKLLKKGGVVNE